MNDIEHLFFIFPELTMTYDDTTINRFIFKS